MGPGDIVENRAGETIVASMPSNSVEGSVSVKISEWVGGLNRAFWVNKELIR